MLVNFSEKGVEFEMLKCEDLKLASRPEIRAEGNIIELPGMSLAVLVSSEDEE